MRCANLLRMVRPFAALALLAPLLSAQEPQVVPDWLVLGPVDAYGRIPFRADAVFGRYLARPDAEPPGPGDEVVGTTATARWEAATAGDDGRVGGTSGWAYAALDSDRERVVMARVRGATTFFVDGVGHVGDRYGSGFGDVPVRLRAGRNDVYVAVRRGRSFVFQLRAPEAPVVVGPDLTMPAALEGERGTLVGSVRIANATLASVDGLAVRVSGEGFSTEEVVVDRGLAPLEVRMQRFAIAPRAVGEAGASYPLTISVVRGGEVLSSQSATLAVRASSEVRRVTFRSRIDGSVQYYGLRPPAESLDDAEPAVPRLVLSLHGAGVQGRRQAASYSPRPDFWVAAPTNRRPFGFDWQDWGRADAYEVLADALARSGVDRRHVSLSGHSMGGHGTWHLAANDPDGFAAIAPSAGWIDFDSYGGRPVGELDALWRGADRASLTLELLDNLVQLPIYVLHGSNDRNVPASEAWEIGRRLAEARANLSVHFERGKGHWWDGGNAPGVDCLDWTGFFELFRASEIATDPARLRFATVHPSVDSRHHWVEVLQPERYGELARLEAARSEDQAVVELRPENVRAFRVEPVGAAPERWVIEGGSGGASLPGDARSFVLGADGWEVGEPGADEKQPERGGPFKFAFDRRFVFVYGTAGDAREDAELLARARYEQQVWWYRANGGAELVSDIQFGDGSAFAGRNVILYGNADTNAAFGHALPERCPLAARRGRITVGEAVLEGDDVGAAWVYPRRGERDTLVGVVADTGVAGARLGYLLMTFVTGTGYPDYAVWGGDLPAAGDAAVRAAGWFDHAWELAD